MKKLPICKKIISSVFLILHFFIVSPFIPLYSETKQSEKTLIRVGWTELSGYIDKNEYENPGGYVKKYLDIIAQYTDWEYEFVKGSFSDILTWLNEGSIDLVPCLNITPERLTYIDYPDYEMAYSNSTLFARKDSQLSKQNLASLQNIKIAAISPNDENVQNMYVFAKENSLDFNIVYYNTTSEVEKAVLLAEVDAGIVANHHASKQTKIILTFAPQKLYFGCTNSKPFLAEALNKAYEQILIVNPIFTKDFMKRYIPLSLAIEFSLSEKEAELIKNTKPLKIAINNLWQPYEFYDARTKRFYGYTVELFNEISHLTGLKFEYVYERKNKVATADIFGTFGNNIEPAHEMGYKITEPYLKLPLVAIYKNKLDIRNNKTAIIEDTTFNYEDFDIFDSWQPVYFKDQEACLNAVRKGSANQTIMNTFTANYMLEQKRKYYRLKVAILPETHFELCALVKEDLDPAIFAVLNRSIAYVSETYSNYFIIKSTFKANEITLSSILNQMPFDVLFVFAVLISISFITILLNWSKNSKRRIIELKNEQLQDALISEQRANEAKSQFTSRISHEIRSPLNAVIGYISIAQTHEKTNQQTNNYLHKAELAAKQLLSLLNDVLDMSSIASGKIHLVKSSFNIQEVIHTMGTLFYNQAKMADLTFTVNAEKIENEILIGDKLRLTQILTNLLSNAIKFTPRGGNITFTISEEAKTKESTHMLFSVKDTGYGISPDFLEKVFNPYEQQNSDNYAKHNGSGLGLSITKNLVTLMSGAITVESEENKGTTFTVTIPFDITYDCKRRLNSRYKSIFILISSDNLRYRKDLEELFKHCELNIEYYSLEKTFSLLNDTTTAPFQLLILDTDEFTETELAIVKKIKESPLGKYILIVVSSYEQSIDESEGFKAGVSRFISKPLFQSTVFNLLLELFGPYTPSTIQEHLLHTFPGKKILLVEDNEMNIEIASELLKKYEVEIIIARNGQEALELFLDDKKTEIDLIFMDIQMPVMDGYEATRKIRSSQKSNAKTIPIVAMTANAFAEDISLSLASGMNNHLSKPINVAELFEVLTTYLQ